jgi:O-antigen/teichoic acid export membrane protein
MRREKHNVVSHAAVYLLARGLPGVVAFFAIPVFSRVLEPGSYGRYALAVASVNVTYALLLQWLRLSLVRYLAAPGREPAAVKSTLLTAMLAIVAATGALAAACLVPAWAPWRAMVGVCWGLLAVQSAFELGCEYARAALRPWQYMRMQLFRAVGFVALGVAFVFGGAGWWGPAAGMGVGMMAAVALSWRRDWRDVRLKVDRGVLAALAQYGLPLSVTVALTVVISSSDRYLIAGMMGEGAAGLYAVAADFTAQTITLLMVSIQMAVFPLAVRAWEAGGARAAQRQMASNGSLLLAVGLPCVVGLAVLAPGVAHTFLGKSFRGAAAGIIPVVALGTFLGGLKNCHFDAAFQFAHRTISQVWIVLAAAAVNVGLNVVAIPRWGINGAAGASVVAYVVAIALTVWVGRRHVWLPIPPADAARVVAAAAVMGAVLWPWRGAVAPAAVAAQVVGGALVYGAVLVGTDFMGVRGRVLGPRAVVVAEGVQA